MSAIRAKLGDGGRVIIPAAFRQNMHLIAGDDIMLNMQDGVIYITTPNQALRKLQTKVKNYTNATDQGISLLDQLIAIRRSDADL